MCDHNHFLEMVHGISVHTQGSVLKILSSPNLYQFAEIVNDAILRISEKIKENLNLLREERV